MKIKTKDGYEGVVDSSIRRIIYEYADDGRVINPICELVKIDKLIESSDGLVYECNREKRDEALKSVEYLDKNTIIITRDNIPFSFKKIHLRNKRL